MGPETTGVAAMGTLSRTVLLCVGASLVFAAPAASQIEPDAPAPQEAPEPCPPKPATRAPTTSDSVSVAIDGTRTGGGATSPDGSLNWQTTPERQTGPVTALGGEYDSASAKGCTSARDRRRSDGRPKG